MVKMSKKIIALIVVVILLVIIGGIVYFMNVNLLLITLLKDCQTKQIQMNKKILT